MQDYEVDENGAGFDEVPTEILIGLMFNVMEEIACRLEPRKPN